MAHDLKALAREWFDKVWNQKDRSAIARLAAENVLIHGLGGGAPAHGHDAFRAFYEPFLSAFPDIQIHTEDVLVDGDKTAARIRATGSHTGEGLGIAPTGRPFNITGIIIARWENGRIAEAWNEFDEAGLLRQVQAPAAKVRP